MNSEQVAKGGVEMREIILVNPEKCVGCRNCALACSFAKEESFSLGQARIGTVWVPELGMNVPLICQHCTNPLCLDVCPMGAISRDEETGAVVLNQDLCIGCRMCIVICPFGGPVIEPESGLIVKCDLCQGDPECVKHCVYGALEFLPADEVAFRRRRAGVTRLFPALEKLVQL